MIEYPKVIQTGGITVTVTDAADEARWMAAVPPAQLGVSVPEPEPVVEEVAELAAAPVIVVSEPLKRRRKKK